MKCILPPSSIKMKVEPYPINISTLFCFRKTHEKLEYHISFLSSNGEEVSWFFNSKKDRDEIYEKLINKYSSFV
jgi:hypothetical protein